jgi:hypothetical protein
VGFGEAIAIIAPAHPITVVAAGIAGTVFELEGSGDYQRPEGAPLGAFTIYMANDSGGSLLELASVPSVTTEDFWVNVTVPSTYSGTPFAAGPYVFWSDNESTTDTGCGGIPFDLTAIPPPSIGCTSWSPQLLVTSPTPATGPSGTAVQLHGTGFSVTGDTTIYWANATGSPDLNVGTTAASSPNGLFATTVTVPSGYPAGLYAFWAIDGDSDCSGAVFNLTATPSPTVPAHSSPSPLSSTDWEILIIVILGLIVILIAVATRRRKKDVPPSAASSGATGSGSPPGPS